MFPRGSFNSEMWETIYRQLINKDCMVAAAEEMCSEKACIFKNVSLSEKIVARRVDDIEENMLTQLSDKNRHLQRLS